MSELERWIALLLRAGHLMAIVWLGAGLMGGPVAANAAGGAVLATGTALLALDLVAGRVHLGELAGAVIVFKLAAVALGLAQPAWALPIFWGLVLLSALSSHAPKAVRHKPLRARRQR
jgi:hypothetical protein